MARRTPAKPADFKFKIDAFTPSTLPMARLAEYMASLATLLGEDKSVHFLKLAKGSTVIVQRIEPEAIPKVEARIIRVRKGDGPAEAMDAFKALNKKLQEDNGVGVLLHGKRAPILRFPGRETPRAEMYGPFNQKGTIDGVPIRIGGKNEIVPVIIQEGSAQHHCKAKRNLAKRIAEHLFTTQLRFVDTGRWFRDEAGSWNLDFFMISDFQVIKDAPLTDVVNTLRAVRGSEWDKLPNAWEELRTLRHGRNGNA